MNATRGKLLEHAVDGIREYDNPTPGWWHLLFWGTIIFSAVYGAFFHFSEFAWDERDTHTREQSAYYARLFGALGDLEGDDATIAGLMSEEKWLKVGHSVYARNCAQCHGAEGGGINGPNMTDDAYKNVKTLADVYKIVSEGVVEKGMPAWNNRLQKNERVVVAAFVASLRGKAAAGGKPPEGEVIAPFPKGTMPAKVSEAK
ncbi:MAG: c-type cytochrome [Planctomycetes bacterium]|nr:c-type cytochrome [Planctomycetota bacterium]